MFNDERVQTSFRKLVYREKWYASPYQTALYIRTTNIELKIGDELNGATTGSSNIVTNENLECVAYKPKRDISPEFFTENPAKLMRLGQFMQRELPAIKSLRDSANKHVVETNPDETDRFGRIFERNQILL